PGYRGGVSAGGGPPADGDGRPDVTAGAGGTSHLKTFTRTGAELSSQFLPAGVSGGVPFAGANTAPNAPPVLGPIGGRTGVALQALTFAIAATDADANDALAFSASGLPAGAVLDPGTGAFNWTPSAQQTGAFTVTFTVTDGRVRASETVVLTIAAANAAPVITSNGGGPVAGVSAADGQTTVVTTVTATDPDPGTVLTYSIAGGADAARFAIDPSTGVLTFVSAPSHAAPADVGGDNVYDVVVRAFDGALAATQAIAVTVTAPPNQPPVLTVTASGPLNVLPGLIYNVAASVADPDAGTGPLAVTVSVSGPGAPLLQLLSISGITFTGGTSPIGQTVTFTGSLAAVNGSLATLYLISSPISGVGTITYTVSDQGNTGSGGAGTDTRTLTYTAIV
ncbi:putative Ig domain-containing protein, partial [Gemmata sp. JC673]